MSWAAPDDIFSSTSLAAYLDKKLLVLLRDGRKLMGFLRFIDHFANAVLEEVYERVIVDSWVSSTVIFPWVFTIRGENVVLIGELDMEKEELPAQMVQVSEAEIKRGSESRERRNAFEGYNAKKNGIP